MQEQKIQIGKIFIQHKNKEMKRLITFLIAFLITGILLAQTTNTFKYPLIIGTNTAPASNGQITLKGSTSGTAVIRVPVAAGTGTVFQLPANNGTSDYLLRTDGSGILTWVAPPVTFPGFGTSGSTAAVGNDARLSDARTPTSHTHGSITNGGLIGTTANLPLITSTGGLVGVGSFGTGSTNFTAGNDARLSDARTPVSHTHGNITNAGAIGTTTGLPIVTTTSGVLTTGESTELFFEGDTTITAAIPKFVFKTSDGHYYVCVSTTATSTPKWKRIDN